MDIAQVKNVIEAALLAAGRPLPLEKLGQLFASKGGLERAALKQALEELAADYEGRGIELKEVASGYRIQVRRSMSDWLTPLWEERAPRYTRALLETLALIAYRQPITRGEIEEVRGVVVSPNIVRTLLERGWVRVVGHRDVPGKPEMFGTTREFLDYFNLKKLDDLPPLTELRDWAPQEDPQTDLQFEPGTGGDDVHLAQAALAPEDDESHGELATAPEGSQEEVGSPMSEPAESYADEAPAMDEPHDPDEPGRPFEPAHVPDRADREGGEASFASTEDGATATEPDAEEDRLDNVVPLTRSESS